MPKPSSPKKLLIIDDDEGILDALKLALEDYYLLKLILKCEEVLKIVLEFKPDLIILDVLISGKDGHVICKTLKANEKTRSIPVIMISAHPAAEKSIKECGAEDYLPKPFEIAGILKKINKYI